MTLAVELGVPMLCLSAIAGAFWLRDRRISRKMNLLSVEQLLAQMARRERMKRAANGQFRHRSIWNQPQ